MLIPGTRVGDFLVETALGSGAVAVVYRVCHEESGRRYALKVLRLLRANVERRFLREARIQAALGHPGIVPVRDMIEVGEAPGLLQEWINGPPLDRWIAQARPSTQEGLAIFRGILAAVSHAHRVGVVHRDLKPQNILMQWAQGEWRPRITDFGIAKLLNQEDSQSPPTADGAVLGTAGFMAPEQYISAGDADERSDIFSLGTILYQLMTGIPAFPQSGIDARRRASEGENYPPAAGLGRALPSEISVVIAGCLRAAASERWTDCAALAAALPKGPRPLPMSEQPTEIERTQPDIRGRTSHVPAALDEFVGRESELHGLGTWTQSDSRVLTILGPGGIGKTRLALRFAEAACWRFPGGVWFVDLTSAGNEAVMLRCVAQALGIPLEPVEARAQLGRVLKAHDRALVILDNLEQIADVAAAVVSDWIQTAPNLQILQTSRRRQQVPGERVLNLGGLSAIEGVSHPGVELFQTRARDVRADLTLDETERRAVAQIVEELEGIPLAIELVAARAAVMMPSDIARRLVQISLASDGPSVFKGGMLGAMAKAGPERHRTMADCLDWSWSLLSVDERSALSQIAVFEGGFTLDAAEGVVQVEEEGVPVFDLLQRLCDHSMITLRSSPDPGVPGRFHVLDLVRAFALDQLECREEVEARHGRYFAEYGTPAFHQQLSSDDSMGSYQSLLLEVDNLARATMTAVGADEDETATRLLSAGDLLVDRGFRWPQWPESVEVVYARAPEQAPRRCVLTRMLGWDVLREGNWQRAIELFTEGLTISERCGESLQGLLNRIGLSYALRTGGDLVRAYAAVQPVPAAAEGLGLHWVEVRARMALVGLVPGDVELAQGMAHLTRAIEVARNNGDIRGEVAATVNLAMALGDRDRDGEADVLMEKVLSRVQVLGRGRLVAEVMSLAGVRCLRRGDVDLAVAWLRRANQMIASLGHIERQTLVRSRLMQALAVQGGAAEVADLQAEQLEQLELHEVGDRILFETWWNMAHAALILDEQETLRQCMQQVESILDRKSGDQIDEFSRFELDKLREAVANNSVVIGPGA